MENSHALPAQDVLAGLNSSQTEGLAANDVQQRLQKHGLNRLTQTEAVRWPQILLHQFTNFLILVLLAAAVISGLLGDLIDAIAIIAIVVLNGLLGFAQEWKAENALKNLKNMLSPTCRVLRNGKTQTVEAEQLVPGDIVLLKSGDRIPADMRVIEAVNLHTEEAALTGESLPVDKNREATPQADHITAQTCMLWMGTHVVNGNGKGVVTATGMQTEFGRIAGLTGSIEETQTRLQRQLAGLAKQLTVLIISVIATVMLIGWIGGKPPMQMLLAGIALAVSAIPEGLPAVVTITLALGVRIMARRKALLRHLQTAETLGATSVICTDKTGTLTKNEMTIQKLWIGSGEVKVSGVGYEPQGSFSKNGVAINAAEDPDLHALLQTGYICNHAHITKTHQGWEAVGSPTEAAFVTAAQKAHISESHGTITQEFSFNSARKRMSRLEECPDGWCVHVKGAPEVLLQRSDRILVDGQELPLDTSLRERVIQAYQDFARSGLRTLALARKQLPKTNDINEEQAENGLVFLGVAGIIDPPRPEVRTALEKTASAGIRVIMITGDSPETALAVARQVGLQADKAVTGSELKNMPEQQLLRLLDQNIVFARTVPEDKFRIVSLLQSQNQLVAMTGDGVNDAPALKQADIGVAMGIRGTDVAKGASDLVLSDDNFATIVSAIEEGRRQYANIQKFVRYLTSSNVGETLAVFINILLGMPLILYPIQILWINLVTDSVTALSLSVEKAEANVMAEKPRPLDQPILDRTGLMILGVFGTYIGTTTLILYGMTLAISYPLANTVAFTNLVVMSNVLVLNFRSFERPLHGIGWLTNPWLLFAVFAMISLQLISVYHPFMQQALHTVPLGLQQWLPILAATALMVILSECVKVFLARRTQSANA